MSAWVKWTAGAAGALVGAAACGIVVIMVWFAVDPSPKYNNWDFATPLLMLLFAAGAAVVGAAAWGFGAVRLAAGEWRALIAMAVVLALSAVLPVVAVASLKGADLWRAHQKAQREKLSGTKRAFLLDSSGHWHVTGVVQQAREEDPAPAPCEIDQSQPCDGS